MRQTAPRYDLDLDRLADEALVVLAQECDYRPAGAALFQRYHDWACGLVGRRACRSRLQHADAEDARQNAVLGLAEAIRRYDTLQMGLRGGCRFRTFLFRVVSARYIDFLRRLGCLRRHYRSATILAAAPVPAGSGSRPAYGAGDPVGAAQCKEEQARLEQALQQLDEASRKLWDSLAAGTPLRAAARALDISYDAAQRIRRRLLAALAAQLRSPEKVSPAVLRSVRSGE
jgi:RNA polymerase sigma factor (sigma-70 family)